MDRISAKKLLLKEFLDNFNETTPVSFTNKNNFYLLTKPTPTKTTKPDRSPFVRFYIKQDGGDQVSFGSKGSRRFNRMGLISYQVFIPENVGTDSGDVLCKEINDIFEGESFDDIYCYEGNWIEIGDPFENGVFQFNGTIMYNTDQIK